MSFPENPSFDRQDLPPGEARAADRFAATAEAAGRTMARPLDPTSAGIVSAGLRGGSAAEGPQTGTSGMSGAPTNDAQPNDADAGAGASDRAGSR